MHVVKPILLFIKESYYFYDRSIDADSLRPKLGEEGISLGGAVTCFVQILCYEFEGKKNSCWICGSISFVLISWMHWILVLLGMDK